MAWSNPILGGNNTLIRQAIKSADYVAGVSGWTVNADGSAEFNDIVVRGEFSTTSANGSSVRIYSTALGSNIDVLPASATGHTINTGSISGRTLENPLDGTVRSDMLIFGPTVDNDPTGSIEVGSYGGRGYVIIDGDFSVSGGIGETNFYRPGSLVKTSDTTMEDIPNSTIDILDGATYKIDSWYAYDGPTGGDGKFAWSLSDSGLTGDRHINALALNTTSNDNSSVMMIRRGLTTQQGVGTPNGNVNAFTVYHETAFISNGTGTDQEATMQFAQYTSNASASRVQSGYVIVTRIA